MNNFVSIDASKYQAGVCNIGPDEINKRKRAFYFSFLGTSILVVITILIELSQLWRLLLFFPITATVINYLQVRYKFCVYFGFFSIWNFDDLGGSKKVNNVEDHKKDLLKVRKMFLLSGLIGLILTTLLYFVPA